MVLCLPCSTAATLLAASMAPPRSGVVRSCSSDISEEFARRAAEENLLRPKALQMEEAGTLWDGPVPRSSYSALDVIELILSALWQNDQPQAHAGTALLRRFSTDEFRLPGEPSLPRLTPQGLTAFFSGSQYGLLLDRDAYALVYPTDMVSLDDDQAWQEVSMVSLDGSGGDDGGELLAKLGWSLVRRGDGCWVTDAISWHDFRPDYRPGIGEEEWDRSFG